MPATRLLRSFAAKQVSSQGIHSRTKYARCFHNHMQILRLSSGRPFECAPALKWPRPSTLHCIQEAHQPHMLKDNYQPHMLKDNLLLSLKILLNVCPTAMPPSGRQESRVRVGVPDQEGRESHLSAKKRGWSARSACAATAAKLRRRTSYARVYS
jgi:hypothetical protein